MLGNHNIQHVRPGKRMIKNLALFPPYYIEFDVKFNKIPIDKWSRNVLYHAGANDTNVRNIEVSRIPESGLRVETKTLTCNMKRHQLPVGYWTNLRIFVYETGLEVWNNSTLVCSKKSHARMSGYGSGALWLSKWKAAPIDVDIRNFKIGRVSSLIH